MEPTQKGKKYTRERQKYANMHPKQKKARIEQIRTNSELRRNRLSRRFNSMENHAYVAAKLEQLDKTKNPIVSGN